MPEIQLKSAVTKIHQILSQRRARNASSPFFFIVGAGISYPEVLLAHQIESHCREEAGRYDDTTPPGDLPPIESYSTWFARGYPSAEERQGYLRSIMETAKISKANLRLAHLVLDGTVARTVFTPNFDNLLTRALELFGQRPLVCDHPQTVSRMSMDSRDIQIIHVHGSFWFYDCCNLTHEIQNRTGSAPMSVMLEQALLSHSPLVVGYSGWEGDILMSALRRRLEGLPLKSPLFWFCFRKDAIASMPDWLTRHPDINLVIPDEQSALQTPTSPAPQQPAYSSQGSQEPHPRTAGTTKTADTSKFEDVNVSIDFGGDMVTTKTADTSKFEERLTQRPVPELPAEWVFDQLRLKLGILDPPLLKDPFSFFAAQLKEALDTSQSDNEALAGFYNFRRIVGLLEGARAMLAPSGPSSLKPFRDAMSRTDYRGAIRATGAIALDSLTTSEQREALFALMDAALGLYDNSPEELAGYDLVSRLWELLSQQGQADAGVREQVANAMYLKSATLEALHRNQEALTTYDALATRFADAREPTVREQVAKALFSKGAILNGLNRNELAISTYDELIRRFGSATEPVIRENLAKGIFNRGFALVALNRQEEAIDTYGDLLHRFAGAPEPALREQVAKALLNRGVALGALERSEEELEQYDELLERFADAREPALRERVAKGLVNKGATLVTLQRGEEALQTYDEVVRRFGDAEEPVLQEQVAKALFNKGYALGTLNRSLDEIAAYDALLERLPGSVETTQGELVAKALFNRAATLAGLDRNDEAMDGYNEVLRRFAESGETAVREQVVKAFLSKAILYEIAKQNELAVRTYEETIARYESVPDAAIRDYVERARSRLDLLQRQIVAAAETAAAPLPTT